MFDGKSILITGGTGSFGNAFTRKLLDRYKPRRVIIFSRDEYKQYRMQKALAEHASTLRFFLGDVRSKQRLCRAFNGVDYVVHAAALKQVPALEYNPMEAVHTNVLGADNIVEAAVDRGVEAVIALSTDKAVNPVNLYGATKLVAEKIFVDANAYSGSAVRFAAVRYGNVMGSRGSVVPLFMQYRDEGRRELPITDARMTRFWITLDQATDLVVRALQEAVGGEVFVPRIPSMKVTDLARAIVPDCTFRFTGIRPGEKLHECLVSHDEARHTRTLDDLYVIQPEFMESSRARDKYNKYSVPPDGFAFGSDTNEAWLDTEQIAALLKEIPCE